MVLAVLRYGATKTLVLAQAGAYFMPLPYPTPPSLTTTEYTQHTPTHGAPERSAAESRQAHREGPQDTMVTAVWDQVEVLG